MKTKKEKKIKFCFGGWQVLGLIVICFLIWTMVDMTSGHQKAMTNAIANSNCPYDMDKMTVPLVIKQCGNCYDECSSLNLSFYRYDWGLGADFSAIWLDTESCWCLDKTGVPRAIWNHNSWSEIYK